MERSIGKKGIDPEQTDGCAQVWLGAEIFHRVYELLVVDFDLGISRRTGVLDFDSKVCLSPRNAREHG
jgi:hypothetical protein